MLTPQRARFHSGRLRNILLALGLAGTLGACSTTPQVIDSETIDARAKADFEELFANVPEPGKKLSLSEAIARAIKYNLDHRLSLIQTVVSQRFLDLTDFDKLPRLAARAGYTERSNVNASSSLNLDTGVPNFGASTSQDEGIFTTDLELSWNILDFGIAWIDARQASNEVLIAVEQQRRTTANIVRDVRDAYWRLVSAERMSKPLRQLERDIRRGLNDSYAAQKAKLKPLEECLEDQRALLDLQRQVVTLQRGIEEARVELGGLIGVAPGTWFAVEDHELSATDSREIEFDREQLQQIALRNRPELAEEDYRSRNDRDEIRKARLRWIPGFELFAGRHSNDNSFLLNNDWAAAGARLTWDLINVFSAPAAIRLAESQQELGKIRRLAQSMAVLTQVDVAIQRLSQTREDYRLATELSKVDSQLAEQYERQQSALRVDRQTMLEARARDIVSRFRMTIAHAELQAALARLDTSVGQGPATLLDHNAELDDLVAEVDDYLEQSRFEPQGHEILPGNGRTRLAMADTYRHRVGDDEALSRPGR